jgi:hypothetical protein
MAMKEFFAALLFAGALAFLAFLAGVTVMIFDIYPSQQLRAVYQTLYAFAKGTPGERSVTNTHQLYPARYSESGVTINTAGQVQPGITLVTSYWFKQGKWQPAIRLFDLEGTLLHEWEIHPDEIWPETPFSDHVGAQMSNPNNYVHGTWLLPGGDIVFNVEYAGLVRMNACGEVVWTVPYRTHHSVFRDDNGNFWVSGLNWRYEKNPEYVHPEPEFVDETALQVSPDGKILREIFLLKSIYESGYGDLLAGGFKTLDITHLNDVEILSESMASKFPMFAPGDIMVSLRNLSTVLVIDGVTEKVKWHFRHPLIHQHDPDFEPDGRITIFDNHDDMTQAGMRLGPSQLVSVDPATNEWKRVYPLTEEQAFYTQTGGKHQLLANGNRLITEAHGGRVFEVDANGNIVWNWIIETRGDGLVPEVLEGTRYPAELGNFNKICQ